MTNLATNQNGFLEAAEPQNYAPKAMAQATAETAAQEVQVAAVLAKRFPRNEALAYTKITAACKRPAFAQMATYSYKRGGSQVSGASIRLAELLKMYWGNMTSGYRVVEQRSNESVCCAYAWDVENNIRKERIFVVRHERKSGNTYVHLTDPRDLLEHISSQAARHERSCILAIVPQDVIEDALSVCNDTLKGAYGDENTRKDTVRKLIVAFSELGVSSTDIEAKLGHTLESIQPKEIADLRDVYTSISDGWGNPDDYFRTLKIIDQPSSSDDISNDKLKAAIEKKKSKTAKDHNNNEELNHEQITLDAL